jgi:hypothetical protein
MSYSFFMDQPDESQALALCLARYQVSKLAPLRLVALAARAAL